MIIDAHAHVFADPKIKYTPESTTFMSVTQQLAVMDQFGIDKTVILPMSNPEILPEYQGLYEIMEICRQHPDRFIPFCNVDPRLMGSLLKVDASHFEFVLEQYKQQGCKGLGEVSAKIYWDDPRLLNLLAACENVGFPVTFHTSIPGSTDYGPMDDIGFPRFEKVLQKFPNLVFLGHSQGFWAEISSDVKREDKYGYPSGAVKKNGAVPRLMRKYSNLYGDISANSGLNAFLRDPDFAYEFIEEFQDRLVFGQDYCSPTNQRQHIQWLTDAKKQGRISNSSYEKIMSRNIAKLLNIQI